jgi:hypothetical protein
MTRIGRMWAAVGLAGAVLATAACGVIGGGEPEDETHPALRSAAATVKDAKTLKASFTFVQGIGGPVTGDADVVAGGGKALAFTHKSRRAVDPPPPIKGRLLTVDGDAFVRSSQWKPPAGKKWFSVNPDSLPKAGEAPTTEWFALVMSRVLDPLFLLDQGVADVEDVTTTPDTTEGTSATRHETSLNVETDKLGPELTAWAKQTGDAAVIAVSLWLDAGNRPVALEIDSSTAVMLFRAKVSFHDYGAGVDITAPAAKTVERV